jgi:hypothetical protein
LQISNWKGYPLRGMVSAMTRGVGA